MDDYWAGKVVSVQGRVQVRRVGAAEWVPIRLNDTYGFGDMIRVQEQSRAAVVLHSGAILRLDQKTTIIFSASEQEEETSLLDLLHGAAHFFSPTQRRLKVTTPFVNAAIGGTEFFVRVEPNQTLLSVFEGRVAAINEAGSLVLTSGQSATARTGQVPVSQVVVRPRDAVQWALYYPPILDYQPADFSGDSRTDWQAMVRKSIGFFWEGDLAGAFSSLKGTPDDILDPRFFTYRASLHLFVGRVDEASIDIKKALDLDPSNGHAFALQSIIAVAQNKKKQALDLARKAVELAPKSSAAKAALSYAQQAHFDIKGALVSLKEAANLDPENALVQARLAELQLSLGNLDEAVRATRQAVSLNPDIARTQTVLGFVYLIEIKTLDAKNAFKRAIELDQGAPLPRLGLGLARIREGNLKEGRGEIEIAASIDPDNSLIRSYLGKAYFEEKRHKKARNQLAIAKELDALDPTPWFYDAIRKQAINRPVEALQDLQKSIELNDNRAVYRSRLMLDEDLAARSASLGRIYSDLGFQQLALVEGWKSVNTDPGNYSAHRLLADSYAALPRHEIARVSELLQSQLLQPLNTAPLQPQLAESNLHVMEGAGPSDPAFNEFNPLFLRNRIGLQANSVYGGKETWGDDLVLSGLHGRFSYSLGQFHYESDGFRTNNDQGVDIYNALVQVKPFYHTSILVELRDKNRKYGDLTLRFDPDNFDPALRYNDDEQSLRFGFRHSFSPRSDLIGTVAFKDVDSGLVDEPDAFSFVSETDDYAGGVQHIYRTEIITAIGGVGYLESDLKNTFNFVTLPTSITERTDRYLNYYLYAQLKVSNTVNWSMGVSYDDCNGSIEKDQINPKLGVIWNPIPALTLRAAAFRVLNRRFINQQTIEPVQIAGFNQFFSDVDTSQFWRYGVATDYQFTADILGGFEVSRRDLDIPYLNFSNIYQEASWEEDFGRAYLYWTPADWLAVSGEYHYEQFDRDLGCTGEESIHTLKTHRWPVGLKLFCPFGFTAGVNATFVDQKVEFHPDIFTPEALVEDSDSFWNLDAKVSYRLAKRMGVITLEIKNLLDKSFKYQGTDKFRLEFSPERLLLGKIIFSF
ncbi:MAG: TonB-dependent receptor [Desulfobacteraceae bacterium]|nr:TonB-dependent receptor [Desulfobacteraceae bacterium]MBC2718621.1 TonB-dependent receptor [Desulfobacteraceae bacterium]